MGAGAGAQQAIKSAAGEIAAGYVSDGDALRLSGALGEPHFCFFFLFFSSLLLLSVLNLLLNAEFLIPEFPDILGPYISLNSILLKDSHFQYCFHLILKSSTNFDDYEKIGLILKVFIIGVRSIFILVIYLKNDDYFQIWTNPAI